MTDLRNVVLVTIDSLRADHCGFMGYEKGTTPTLDQMAANGLTFENAIAPGPSTYDSMPAIFTGRRMVPHTAGDRLDGDTLDRITENIELNMHGETLTEWFDRNGYETGAFTTNPYTGKQSEFARGFNRYEDFMGDGEGAIMQKAAHIPVLAELKHVVTLLKGDRASKQWTDYYSDIIEWTQNVEEPYFLWVFLLDTHTPYLADDQFRTETSRSEMYYHNWRLWLDKKWRESNGESLDRETLVSLYDDTIRSVDAFLSRLLADLTETDPAVVVHADHGEAFGEHGTYGHQDTLYEENIHVPLLVYDGNGQKSEDRPISLTKIPDLLREIATDSSLSRTSSHGPGIVMSKTWDGKRVAVRTREQKYIATVDTDTGNPLKEVVYDLSKNEGERTDQSEDFGLFIDNCRSLLRREWMHCQELSSLVSGVDRLTNVSARIGVQNAN